jgi:hypothetical protein
MKKILILTDGFNRRHYIIDALALRWGKSGYKVCKHYGTKNIPDADIVILHIDSTIVPDKYVECLARYPVVLNRDALNISKTIFSENIITPDDAYSGPVIIKTIANYGGIPETNRVKYIWSRLNLQNNWGKVSVLDPAKYPIFKDKESVPAGVWKNKHLIVEKFLPERTNGLFFLRYWIFFGQKGWAGRFGSQEPIVKFGNMATKEEMVSVPEELTIWRKKLGFDYGRFDYVEHNGKAVLFDANKTVGGGHHMEAYSKQLDFLAAGISDF